MEGIFVLGQTTMLGVEAELLISQIIGHRGIVVFIGGNSFGCWSKLDGWNRAP